MRWGCERQLEAGGRFLTVELDLRWRIVGVKFWKDK